MSRDKRPLTGEEQDEKLRLSALVENCRPTWEEEYGVRLTQERLGAMIGEIVNGKPMSQGAIWQYLSTKSRTKLNDKIVLALAVHLGFDPGEVGERFAMDSTPPIEKRYLAVSRGEKIAGIIESYRSADAPTAEQVKEFTNLLSDVGKEAFGQELALLADELPPADAIKVAQYFLQRASERLAAGE